MLKNKELVLKMSLEQRISLILSSQYGESGFVENYNFPVFSFNADPANNAAGTFATLFPSDAALACAWDEQLVASVYKCKGNEAKANVSYACFTASNDYIKENISEESFATGKFTAAKARGLNFSGAYFNLECLSDDKNNDTDFFVTGEALPDSVTFNGVNGAEEFPSRYGYCGLLYGAASCKEEVAQYLFYGCTTVFLNGDFKQEATDYLISAAEQFKTAQKQYKAGKITLAEFDRRCRSGEIVDEELINAACDRAVTNLLNLKGKNAYSIGEVPAVMDGAERSPLFNEPAHAQIALSAAQSSCVLLKNAGKILPLDRYKKVAVIGEYAKNEEYLTGLSAAEPTAVRVAFEVINDYEINTTGYAHGYLRGESGRKDLLATASELCEQADCALVYLYAERGARELPAGQLELIDELASRNVKIIAVVSADGVIDTAFTDSCAAVIYAHRGGQGEVNAVLDIITGKVNPCGRLAKTFPYVLKLEEGGAPATSDNARFPLGFGLSYTQFEYRNLKITDAGVSFTVVNTGEEDGYAVSQLYIKKEGAGSFTRKTLRGFKKSFIKKHDAVKVEIPFDKNTFRTYSEEKNAYVVEGGGYTVCIAENANDIKLSAEMTLAPHMYAQPVHTSTEISRGESVGFTKTKEDKIIRGEKAKLSFGLKLFLALMLTLYYDGVLAVFAFTNFIADKDLLFYIILGALAAVGNLLAIIYIIVIAKKRKYQKYLHPNQVLSQLVDKVRGFKEVAKVSYEKPVSAPEEEFIPEEVEEEQPAEPETVKPFAYGRTFGNSETEETIYANRVSFTELCDNFRAFALSKGVAVEPSSLRALFAAFAAGRLIILNCKNPEAKPAFLAALAEYFGNAKITAAADEWKSPDDLLWVEEEEMFVTSAFANAVNAAVNLPSQNMAVITDNVNSENVLKYFGDFIAYASSPSEKRTVTLSDELSLELPDNIRYILVPADGEFKELPPELARAAVIAEPIVSKAEPSGEAVEIKCVSKNDFEELVTDARERCFLPEKLWKRIDALCEAISANEKFYIDNKDVMRLEKYSAVLLDCGGDEAETLINMFTAKIIPLLKLTHVYRGENGGTAVAGIIEKLFGDEDISVIRKALNTAAQTKAQTDATVVDGEENKPAEQAEATAPVMQDEADNSEEQANGEPDRQIKE